MRIFRSYIKFNTSYEKATDIGTPLVLSIFFAIFAFHQWPQYSNFHQFTSGLLGLVVTILSILAGFNVASMAIIGAAPGSFVKELATHRDENERSHLEGLMAMFAWAVLLQLVLLVACLIYFVMDALLIVPSTEYFTVWTLQVAKLYVLVPIVSIGFFLTLHSIILSMRNVAGLFLLILKTVGGSK